MKKFLVVLLLTVAAAASLLPARMLAEDAGASARPEIRAFWVDAFHDGAKTPAQIDKLVHDAVASNINTLIVQVRRRGDAYYNKSVEPRTEDPVLPKDFDALQYLIDAAHAYGIEVHAWLNTLVAWNAAKYPEAPTHMWNLHGPKVTGRENWVSYVRQKDKNGQWGNTVASSYYMDPGHPDVIDYTAEVYANVVRNYKVDGVHLDYSRYNGQNYGYNPTSIARFNERYGLTGLPLPEDPLWSEWRREQINALSRQIYLKCVAINPAVKVSSATIAWGAGPVTEEDWATRRNYYEVFQDWQSWLKEGTIDIAMPMNYDREWNADQQLWFNQWIEWEKDHQHNRQTTIGPAIYLQYIEQGLEQIRRAQAPSARGNYAAGVCLYSYACTNLYATDDYKDPNSAGAKALPRQPHVFMPETNEWFYRLLANDGGYSDPVLHTFFPTTAVFPTRVPVPEMPWKTRPTKGHLMGTVADFNGKTYDRIKVTLVGPETRELYTDGNGWFGAVDLIPGHYQIMISKDDFVGRRLINAWVEAGRVAVANFEQFWVKGSSGYGCEKLEIDETVPMVDPFTEEH